MTLHRVRIAAAIFIGAALLQPSVFAQKTSGTTGGSTGLPGTNTGTTPRSPFPTNNPTTTNNNSTSPYPNTIQRPVFISGKVVIEGGLPLPTGVSIVRVCGASTRTVAYTDSKGRFQFEWGHSQGILPDASDTSSMRGIGSTGSMDTISGFPTNRNQSSMMGQAAETEMMNCELRAAAPGYQSDSVNLAGRRSLDNPEVGSIVLHRLGNIEGTSISATSFNAPKDARKAFDKGVELMHKGKSEEATRSFEKAVDAYPNYADAWYQLGRVRSATEDRDRAKDAYVKALDADSKLVGPCVELGLMSIKSKNWAEAVQYLDRAVRLDPLDFPQAWFGNAIAHFNLKSYDLAEKSVREAIKLDPKNQNPRAGYLLGLILAEKQDFTGASKQLREFLRSSPDAKEAEMIRKQLGQMEKLASATPEDAAHVRP